MSASGASAKPPEAEILEQLDRILNHSLFRGSARLSRFLTFSIRQDLAGLATGLKEHTIGVEVFDRGVDFNPQTDPIVRIMAGRLRGRLAEYYAAPGASDPVVIEIPRGGYAPQYRWRAAPAGAGGMAPVEPLPAGHKVGRETELSRLESLLGTVAAGSGRVALISGEAGIGKTTVAELFLEQLRRSSFRVRTGRGQCSDRFGETDAFVPIYECLLTLSRAEDGGAVQETIKAVAPTWYSEITPGAASSGQRSHERMRREFVLLLEELARAQPVVLIVDDLQWADASTCDLLAYVSARIRSRRVLILIAYRTAESQRPSHPFGPLEIALAGLGIAEELPLAALSPDDTARYIAASFPRNAFPAGFAEMIHERTEGNPLFMTDLLRFLRARRILMEEEGVWRAGRPLEAMRTIIPPGVTNMVRMQLDQLVDADRELLLCAAAQGMQFDSGVLAEVLERDPAEVEERLRELATIYGYIEMSEEREFPDGTFSVRYRFVHVLYQDALQDVMAPSRRAVQSAAIARTLVRCLGRDARSVAGELALLFEAGRDAASAAEYFLRAAGNAARVFAYAEAEVLCRRGLRALLTLPDSPERDAHELKFSLLLGLALMATQGYGAPDAERVHRRSRELCLRSGETGKLLSVLWALHTCAVNGGELARSLDLAAEMRERAEQLGERIGIVESLHALGTSLAFVGRQAEARAALSEIFDRYPQDRHVFRQSLFVMDPYVTSLSMLARLLAYMGLLDDARRKASESVALAARLAHPPTLAYATFWIGWIAHAMEDYDEAVRCLEHVAEWCRDLALPQLLEWSRLLQGSAIVHLGLPQDGVAWMRESIERQQALRSLIEKPFCLTLLAEALLKGGGSRPEALALCNEAILFAGQSQNVCYQAETYRVRGEIRWAENDERGAEEDFRRSLSIARQDESALLELRTAVSLNRLLSAMGEEERSREVLEAALGRIQGDASTVRRARRLLGIGP